MGFKWTSWDMIEKMCCADQGFRGVTDAGRTEHGFHAVREWRIRRSAAIPMGGNERSVKPSAQPTLVRTQHLPPPAEIARELDFPGLAGCCF